MRSIEDVGPDVHATFVPADPARAAWFALWRPDRPGGLLADAEADAGGAGVGRRTVDVELVLPASRGTRPVLVTAERLSIAAAIEAFATLPASAELAPSVHTWAAVVRAALELVGRARVLPWVSPAGWDTWRLDPLDPDDLARVEALAAALPAVGHCVPSVAGRGRIVDPVHAVRACYDAVADRLLRPASAPLVAASPVFSHPQPTRVRHLRPWVRELASSTCAETSLVLRVHPPDDVDDPWTIVFQLGGRHDPSVVVDAADVWTDPASTVGRLGARAELELLAGLRRAASVAPVLAGALEVAAPTHVELHDEALDEVLDALDELAEVGVEVRWPAELVAPTLERRVVVGAVPTDSVSTGAGLDDLLTVDWEFLLDGTALTPDELAVLAAARRSVVSLRGRWVRLDRRTRRRLGERPPQMTVAEALAAALGDGLTLTGHEATDRPDDEVVSVRLVGHAERLAERIRALDRPRELPAPAGLTASLRPYQRRGLAWMAELGELGLGGCLADDMGLGKTVQVLALHALRGGPTLVVCPTGLVTNWVREAERFCPDARVVVHHGAGRRLVSVGPGDLVLTTYGVVRSDADVLAEHRFDLVVADEAQHVKNPRSRSARALRRLRSDVRIALTGTPVENRLAELWSILDWAVPGLLGSLDAFTRAFAIPIERDGDPDATERLHELVRPFLLRRRKTDPGIAPELPTKTERDVVVGLTTEQVTLYRAAVDEALAAVADAAGLRRRGLVLGLLTSLKQITNHPAHYLGQTGPLADRSGKLSALDELVDEAVGAGESTLVFTQYVAMGRLLVDHLRQGGVDSDLVHGQLTPAARTQLTDRFQQGELPVLVLSLKAAGTGLNLTRATQVVHFDRWWNPAVEDQATDRAHRIGQHRPVTVHRLITLGTVEDRVAELLGAKRQLADRVVGSGEAWLADLDDATLASLVRLDEHPVRTDAADRDLVGADR